MNQESRPYLVLLPGLLCDRALWEPQIAALSDVCVPWVADLTRDESFASMAARVLAEAPAQRFALAGLSMGGGGSYIYALHRPELFSSACPLSADSGPITMNDAMTRLKRDSVETTDAKINEYYNRQSALALVNAIADDKKKAVRWYIDCGDDDFLYEGNSLIHIAMRKKEIPHEFRIRDGAHNWSYWRESLPDVLQFISQGFHQY